MKRRTFPRSILLIGLSVSMLAFLRTASPIATAAERVVIAEHFMNGG